MKRKIFLTTLLLFFLFFYSTLLLISLKALQESLDSIKERCLAEHFVVATSLIGDIEAVEARGESSRAIIESIMSPYVRYAQNRSAGMAVSCDGDWIWQNGSGSFVERVLDPEELAGELNERTLFTEKEEQILYIYGTFPAPYDNYGLLYSYPLEEDMTDWRSSRNLLFLGGLGVMVLLAGCLLYVTEMLFRPLRQVAKASRKIAAGSYEERIPTNGKDELSEMAADFNQMAEEIQKRIRQLEENAAAKQQFIDDFAHELRTPLTAIYGYAEYLQKTRVSEEDKYSATNYIMKECRRLQETARQLLELATLRENELVMERIPLSELLADSENSMREKASRMEITLLYYNKVSDQTCIHGSRELLLVLLNNLIDNAIKASTPGNQVVISLTESDGKKIIAVQDKGIGMTQEQLAHVTEAFYRADKARGRQPGGAGLGLSICEKIASLHKINMVFSSVPGKGTCVTLTDFKISNILQV